MPLTGQHDNSVTGRAFPATGDQLNQKPGDTKMLSLISTTTLLLNKFRADTRGVTAIEYGLIASLMAVILIAVFTLLGASLTTTFTNIGTHLTTGK